MAREKQKATDHYRNSGSIFVISAPSGAGKTTLCNKLLKNMPELRLSVSYTTRSPRKGEVNDIDYSFVSERKFRGMIDRGEFAEWAMVHGNMYGTSLKRLKQLNRQGYDIILDIDINGARQIKKTCAEAVYIFVLPPSFQTLEKRLANRKTDSEEVVARRLENAKAEIARYSDYDYIVVNDSLEEAYNDLRGIIRSSRIRTENINSKWIKGFIN